MTQAADLLLTNASVYPLSGGDPADPRSAPSHLLPTAPNEPPSPRAEAVALRDGQIVAVGAERDLRHRAGVETRTLDLDGRPLLPGFVDAHTHLVQEGLALVHADLSEAADREEALALLAARAEETDDGWVIGVRYDESAWPDGGHPTRAELDAVADDRPVAAVRVDLHTAALNTVALERVPERHREHVQTRDGEATGVVVEGAAGAVEPVFDPDLAATRRAVEAAIDRAASLGITCVHDKVRRSHAPRVYRDLEREGALDCRVRIDYWADHLDALREAGLRTGDGTGLVGVGAIKSFSDGSIGGRTARLSEPYADAGGDTANGDGAPDADGDAESDEGTDQRGAWVVEPDEVHETVADAVDAGFQVQVHAIGDAAIEETCAALEPHADRDAGDQPPGRHRIEHAELATDEHVARMADAGIVASMQPNFHRWAGAGGLYESALGPERARRTNRLRSVATAGVPLAFGSDCMPMDPLTGVHHAVNAPAADQRLSVGAALRAYSYGAAYAGFDEDLLGTVEVGKRADLVALEASPWERPDAIDEIDVALTVVDGRTVFDGR